MPVAMYTGGVAFQHGSSFVCTETSLQGASRQTTVLCVVLHIALLVAELFCLATLIHFSHSGFDIIIVCHVQVTQKHF